MLALAAIWVVQPMHDVTWWASHEHVSYPVRVREYLEAWRGGAWYPRWCPDLYGGYGYPFFEYYAPGVFFASSAIAKLTGLGPIAALEVVVTICAAATALGTYGLIRGATGRRDAALLGAACYVFLPYRCTDLFARGDLAEYCAYCLAPFALWLYRALARSTGDRAAALACGAAVVHAAMLLTHTLLGMFATEGVAIYALVLVWRRRPRAAVLVGAALGFAIAIAAVYVVPAFLERDLVFLDRVIGDRYTPWQNAVAPAAFRDPFFTPGWPFAIGLVAWAGSFAVARTRRAALRAAVPWAIALAMTAAMLPGVVAIWKLLPFGAQTQFPWRLLGLIGLASAIGIAMWWAELVPASRGALIAAVVLCLPLPALLSDQRRVTEEYAVPDTPAQIRAAWTSTAVMDEYLPRTVAHAPTGPRAQLAWTDDADARVTARELDGLHLELELDAPHATRATLGVFGFCGWHVRTLDGPAPARLRTGDGDGLLRVTVPRAGHYAVEVYFGRTTLRTTAAAISLLALLALVPALRRLARQRTDTAATA